MLVDHVARRDPDPDVGWVGWAAMTVAPNGNVYVDDYSEDESLPRLRMLDSKGRWRTVAESGKGLGQIGSLWWMATDSFGRLYVYDYDNARARVQVRDLNGKWYELSDTGATGYSELSQAYGIAVDRPGIVYVAASIPPSVFRWTPQPSSKAATRASKPAK